MIKAFVGGEWRELEALEPDTDEKKANKKWCQEDLMMFFRSTKCGIKSIDYYCTKYGEFIRVFYDQERVCHKDAWITGDSRAAIVEDMYRQHVVY